MTQLTTTNRQGFAPATITEAMEFSKMLSESAMVPRAYQGKPQDIMVCVQWGYEIGLAPMQALQNIAVINGKPSVYGDAAMALVQASPVCEDIEEYFEGEGTPNPIAVCVAKRKGRKPVVAKFSVEDAKRAGLWGKQGPWTAYPKRMMQMRARGFALRDAFPDVLKGLITAEEAQDYPDEAKPKQPRDITPRNPLDMVAPPVAIPQQTSDPVVIEQAFAQDAEAEELATKQEPVEEFKQQLADAGVEVVHIPEVTETSSPDEPAVVVGFPLFVPGKVEPHAVFATLDEWQDGYEDLAEKTARAGKRPARERMTILRELKEANADTMKRVDTVKRLRHTASYQQRIKALGAAQ
jgi:RecT family